MGGTTANSPNSAPNIPNSGNQSAEKQQQLDARGKLRNLKRSLEKKINAGNDANAKARLEEIKKMEEKAKEGKELSEAEKQGIAEDFEKLPDIEKKIDESDLKPNQPEAAEAPKDFLSNIGTMIEHYGNFLAYHLAPIMEALQKIPFLGGDANIAVLESFLGMDRTMLFGSLRKKGIDPVFHPDRPELDTLPINHMIEMAKEIQGIHSKYTVKGFFDTAALKFADHLQKTENRKTFELSELDKYVTEHVFKDVKAEAGKDKAAEGPSLPVTLKAEGVNAVSATRDGKTVNAKIVNGKVDISGSPWQLSYKKKNDVLPVTELKIENGQLQMTVDTNTKNPLTGAAITVSHIFKTNQELEDLLKQIERKTPYTIEAYGVEFKPAV